MRQTLKQRLAEMNRRLLGLGIRYSNLCDWIRRQDRAKSELAQEYWALEDAVKRLRARLRRKGKK